MPSASDDLRFRRTEPLFTEASRQLVPYDRPGRHGMIVQVTRDRSLTHDDIQQIHDAAEEVLFGPVLQLQTKDAEAAPQMFKEAQRRLGAFLRNHRVDLPEWHLASLVEINAAGEVDWWFVPMPTLEPAD